MKTTEEKLKTCTCCLKRRFDPTIGTICSLTKEKPAFEDECTNYEADAAQIALRKSKEEDYEKRKSISGWLAFFLWVGIGGGAFVTLLLAIDDNIDNELGWFASIISMIPSLAIATIAVYTIVAFCRCKPNAVALAKTYIAMIALDGVLAIVLSIILNTSAMYTQAIRELLWSGIWFTFLLKSESVEELIPTNTRTWGSLEKGVLIIYAAYLVLLAILVAVIM